MTHRNTLVLRLSALMVCLLLIASLFAGCKGNKTEETAASTDPSAPESTGEDEHLPVLEIANYTVKGLTVDDPRLDEIVASCAGYDLNSRQLAIYYWMQFISVVNQYGAYLNIDMSKPLSEQASPREGMTWEQLFVQSALDQFQVYTAVADAAKAEGFECSEEIEEQVSETVETLRKSAETRGFDSVDGYLQESFGAGVTEQDYADYLRFFYYVMRYETEKYQQMDESVTEEDLDAYYEAHKQEYVSITEDTRCIDVRHILVTPGDVEGETDDEKLANAKLEAEAFYAEYLEDPTEEHFAALATEHSSDTGSAENGGLYQNVLAGKMVAPFNDWCFDENRKPGDTGIVQTDYGFHVMYFVAANDYLRMTLRGDYLDQRFNTWVSELIDANEITADYAKIALGEVHLSAEE